MLKEIGHLSRGEKFSPKSPIYRDKEKVASPTHILQKSDSLNRDEKASAL